MTPPLVDYHRFSIGSRATVSMNGLEKAQTPTKIRALRHQDRRRSPQAESMNYLNKGRKAQAACRLSYWLSTTMYKRAHVFPAYTFRSYSFKSFLPEGKRNEPSLQPSPVTNFHLRGIVYAESGD